MNPSQGLKTSLNKMREMSVRDGSIYHQYVPLIGDDTSIGEFGQPILDPANTAVLNDFVSLLKKIVAFAIDTKRFDNPLRMLEGERMPLGNFIEEAHVDPVKGRKFNVNDFAGLLQKYEAEVKTQYLDVNMDMQYPVTITRAKIKNAFTSWNALENFITGIIDALYNAAYIDEFNFTKALVTEAYAGNKVQYAVVDAVTSEATGKALVKALRKAYTKMAFPSRDYNAWNKLDPKKRYATTWSDKRDIMVMISSDVEAEVDVEVLASAFNMSKTDFLGRVIVVDDFSVRDNEQNVVIDGSNIQAMIFDRAWFKIRQQDFELDEFYNPNNRTWQYFLNNVKMFNYSLFANALVLATEAPTVDATAISVDEDEATVTAGEKVRVDYVVTPPNATTTVTATSSATGKATVEVKDGYVEITGVEAGSATITVSAGAGVTDTISVTVEAGE